MTPERSSFAPYVRQLADLLGLRDWKIEVSDESPSVPDAIATIVCVAGRKLGTIRLSEGFLTDSAEAQRHTMTHELIHCHFAAARQLADNALDSGPYGSFLLMFEYGVDGLADGIAPLLPLPTTPKRKAVRP